MKVKKEYRIENYSQVSDVVSTSYTFFTQFVILVKMRKFSLSR